jgi:hypothetical protein
MVSRNNGRFLVSIEAAKVAVSFISNHRGMSASDPKRISGRRDFSERTVFP